MNRAVAPKVELEKVTKQKQQQKRHGEQENLQNSQKRLTQIREKEKANPNHKQRSTVRINIHRKNKTRPNPLFNGFYNKKYEKKSVVTSSRGKIQRWSRGAYVQMKIGKYARMSCCKKLERMMLSHCKGAHTRECDFTCL